jgi:oxidoreductase iron-sulfur protein
VSGYSGKAVRPIALRFIHELASDPSAGKMPISGIGGIETWRDALDFLLLGCTNLQICTAVMQYGFRIIDDLCEGLRLFMQENGYKTLSDLIGIALPNIVPPEKLERTQIHRPTVDNSLCLGCGRCFVSCNDGGHQAIRFTSMRKPVIDEQKCVGCHLCALVCPTFAIH